MPEITIPDDGGWTIAGAVMGHVQNVLLCGPPGTGKSTFACREGAASWYRIYCHEEMSELDILGGPALVVENGATKSDWQDGAGIRAWREGKRLVIDEVDKAGGAALTALLSITEDRSTAAVTIPMTGETLRPADGFHVVATTNEPPEALPEALKDRFTVRITIDRPHPDAIAALPEDLRKAAYAAARLTDARRASIRTFRSFAILRAKLSGDMGPIPAEGMAALAVFGPDRAQEICDALHISRSGGDPDALPALFEA